MKTLYLECNMGAAGDMLMAALLELTDHPEEMINQLNGLGIPKVEISRYDNEKCGIYGTGIRVLVAGEEEHSHDVSHHHHHDHEHSHDHDHHHHDEEHDHHHGHEHHHDHDEQGHHHSHGEEHEHHHHHDEHGHHHNHEEEHNHHHDHEHSHHEHTHGHGEHHHDHSHEGHHHHWGYPTIVELINGLNVPQKVKEDAIAVYTLIAEAESKAHQKPLDEVHFHEVGSLDAVADVVGCCFLMNQLEIGHVVVSPVHVGSGMVRCAHGVLPVPAPATAHILQGVPTYGGAIEGELCTPTGAALLVHFADQFGNMPVMITEKMGYGMGSKEFSAANCVRAFLGTTSQEGTDSIYEIACNVDDMTGEELGYAMEKLMELGALDVTYTPIYMKKNRPGVEIHCLCAENEVETFAKALFQHTTTIGVRYTRKERMILSSTFHKKQFGHGEVNIKTSSGYGVEKSKVEFVDLVTLAEGHKISLAEAKEKLIKPE